MSVIYYILIVFVFLFITYILYNYFSKNLEGAAPIVEVGKTNLYAGCQPYPDYSIENPAKSGKDPGASKKNDDASRKYQLSQIEKIKRDIAELKVKIPVLLHLGSVEYSDKKPPAVIPIGADASNGLPNVLLNFIFPYPPRGPFGPTGEPAPEYGDTGPTGPTGQEGESGYWGMNKTTLY